MAVRLLFSMVDKSWEESKKSHSMLQFCISCQMAAKNCWETMETAPARQSSSPTFPLVFSIHCAVTLTMQWCHGHHWRHKPVMTSWRCFVEGCRGSVTSRLSAAVQNFFPLVGEAIFPPRLPHDPDPGTLGPKQCSRVSGTVKAVSCLLPSFWTSRVLIVYISEER
jgi:hypothetical protein